MWHPRGPRICSDSFFIRMFTIDYWGRLEKSFQLWWSCSFSAFRNVFYREANNKWPLLLIVRVIICSILFCYWVSQKLRQIWPASAEVCCKSIPKQMHCIFADNFGALSRWGYCDLWPYRPGIFRGEYTGDIQVVLARYRLVSLWRNGRIDNDI